MSEIRRPSFRVYSAVPGASADDELLSIGLGYAQSDGKGLVVVLQALPLHAELVLREIEGTQTPLALGKIDDGRSKSLKQQLDAYERALIEQYLQDAGGVISTVLKWLDVPRRTLSEKMKRLGIDASSFRQGRRRRPLRHDTCAESPILNGSDQARPAQ